MATEYPTYPVTTLAQAEDMIIFTGNQVHDIMNADATSVIEAEDGQIPSIRKALVDNMYFKTPQDWVSGTQVTDPLQLKQFTDGGWYFAPTATVSDPVSLGVTPLGDTNWKPWSKDQAATYQHAKRLAAEAGYNMVSGSFYFGGTLDSIDDVLFYEGDGKYYSWSGSFPKVVAASSTPETTGGICAGAWVDRTQDALRSEFASPDGAKLIGMCSSVAQMMTITPEFDRQRINVLGYYADTPLVGGGSFIGYADTASIHNGFTVFRVNSNYVWKRWKDDINLYDGGARQDAADNSDVLGRAMLLGRKPIQVLPGFYNFQYGITVPPNLGLSLYANVSHKGSVIFQYSPAIDDTATALIKFDGDAVNATYSGAMLRNITLAGIGDPVRHGLEAHFVYHPDFFGVRAEGFKGSGLLIDKCQDGIIDFIEIQNCGRTTGDYSNLSDISNNDLTTHAPLQIYSSVSGDASNMLRIPNLHIEANKVSPSIRVSGGIGLWFGTVHMEHRDGPLAYGSGFNGTFLQVLGAEVRVENVEASQVEWFAETRGYGVLWVTNCGRSGGIRHIGEGEDFKWFFVNAGFTKANLTSSVQVMADKVNLGATLWNYPAGRSVLSSCGFSSLSITNDGLNADVTLIEPKNSGNSTFTTSGLKVFGGRTDGNLSANPLTGYMVLHEHDVGGTPSIQYGYGIHYVPGQSRFKEVFGSGAPSELGGVPYPINTRWYNMAASATGDAYMYVKTSAGWKAVSKIQ